MVTVLIGMHGLALEGGHCPHFRLVRGRGGAPLQLLPPMIYTYALVKELTIL